MFYTIYNSPSNGPCVPIIQRLQALPFNSKIRLVIQAYTNAKTISQVRVVSFTYLTQSHFYFQPQEGITTPSLKTPKTGGGGRWGGCMREKNAGVVGPRHYFFFFSFLNDCAYEYPFSNVFYTNPFFIIFSPSSLPSPSNQTSLPLVFLHVLTIFIINKRLCVCLRVCECVCVCLLENTPTPPPSPFPFKKSQQTQ